MFTGALSGRESIAPTLKQTFLYRTAAAPTSQSTTALSRLCTQSSAA
jgi:hypothetical protein